MSRSIKYTLSDICRIIDENDLKYIRIYDGWLNELTAANYPIHVIFIPAKEAAENGRDIKLALTDFVNRFPYRLTLYMKSSTNGSDNAAMLVHYEPGTLPINAPATNSHMSLPATGTDAVLLVEIERLKAEMREQNFKREIVEKQFIIEHQTTINARISLLVETLADKFLPRIFPELAASPPKAMNMNGITDEEFENSINYLVEQFKPEGIVKLCYLLRTNDMYRNLVHSEINKL